MPARSPERTSRSSTAFNFDGCTAVRNVSAPWTVITTLAKAAVASTSGSAATAGSTAGSMATPLKLSCTITRSPPNVRSTVSLMEGLIDEPNAANSTTTAVPTIRADALPAVRRGLRIALRRAKRPVCPRIIERGAPSTAAVGRATTGSRTTAPTTRKIAASPARISAPSGLDVAAIVNATPPATPGRRALRPRTPGRSNPTDTAALPGW